MGSFLNLTVLAVLVAVLSGPLYRQVTLFGIFRHPLSSEKLFAEGQNLFTIKDTAQCEDLHYHALSNKLFTACEDSTLPRFGWFPPMTKFEKPSRARGSIHVIDPEVSADIHASTCGKRSKMLTEKTMRSTRLRFENDFSGPFITHGIDITPDPERPDAIYIFAVNHAPHPAYHPERPGREWHWEGPKARSQIELFHHVLDTKTVRHVRSIRHPLIRTPNDIYAESPSLFFVTNDHGYREGLRRMVEDTVPLAKWSDLVHVQLDTLEATDAEDGIDATIALKGLYNNNGLGHGRSADEILIASAAGGIFWRAQPVLDDNDGTKLSVVEEVRLESMLDNPTYYSDPYATTPDNDASGFVLAGMRQPLDVVFKNQTDPTAKDGAIVWHMRPNVTVSEDGTTSTSGWETRLLFEDDGTYVRSGSTAVLVPVQTRPNEGKKAWLFVTGFYAKSVVAVKVDL